MCPDGGNWGICVNRNASSCPVVTDVDFPARTAAGRPTVDFSIAAARRAAPLRRPLSRCLAGPRRSHVTPVIVVNKSGVHTWPRRRHPSCTKLQNVVPRKNFACRTQHPQNPAIRSETHCFCPLGPKPPKRAARQPIFNCKVEFTGQNLAPADEDAPPDESAVTAEHDGEKATEKAFGPQCPAIR
jgi:hypothetical protein